jgi:hypothetical protein
MATQVQFRRGTTTQNNAFTGAIGEIVRMIAEAYTLIRITRWIILQVVEPVLSIRHLAGSQTIN